MDQSDNTMSTIAVHAGLQWGKSLQLSCRLTSGPLSFRSVPCFNVFSLGYIIFRLQFDTTLEKLNLTCVWATFVNEAFYSGWSYSFTIIESLKLYFSPVKHLRLNVFLLDMKRCISASLFFHSLWFLCSPSSLFVIQINANWRCFPSGSAILSLDQVQMAEFLLT